MNKALGAYPIRINELRFKDGSSREDIVAMYYDRYLVVLDEDDDTPPTLYNHDCIEYMRGVREIRQNEGKTWT